VLPMPRTPPAPAPAPPGAARSSRHTTSAYTQSA
jgi:hypothetical protein